MDRARFVFLSVFAIAVIGVCVNSAAWGWGNQGHEIIATIAADNLSLSAREQVARILATDSDRGSLEKAIAAASVRPDTEFRAEDRSTAPWHYIDICLQDRRTD